MAARLQEVEIEIMGPERAQQHGVEQATARWTEETARDEEMAQRMQQEEAAAAAAAATAAGEAGRRATETARDEEMRVLDSRFPEYGFARHKGYPTKQHIEALQLHGVSELHRRSYAPVAKLLGVR